MTNLVQLKSFEMLEELGKDNLINMLFPPIEELKIIAKIRKITPIILVMQEKEKITGIGVFYEAERQVHKIKVKTLSLLGYDYLDFNYFYSCQGQCVKYLSLLKKFSKKNYKIDTIMIDNVCSTLDHCAMTEYVYQYESLADDCKFLGILKKTSLVRHRKKAIKELNYSCETVKGSLIAQDDMNSFVDLHVERWAFDDVFSAFLDENRKEIYQGFPQNKLLTIVRDGYEIVAAHFGMQFGDTLLWHTPVINIKYLAYSPLEILLYETVLYAQNSGVKNINYGLGGESYKKRFATSQMAVNSLVLPVSLRGKLVFIIWKAKIAQRTAGLALVLKKRMSYLRSLVFCGIFYYQLKEANRDLLSSDRKLLVVETFEQLVVLYRENNMPIKRYMSSRFRSSCCFFCLVDIQAKICSYGWGSRQDVFYVSEIDKDIQNEGKLMLFDFNTEPSLRGRGYYPELLSNIACHFSDESIVIFAKKNNTASNKGIKKAGFVKRNYCVLKKTHAQVNSSEEHNL